MTIQPVRLLLVANFGHHHLGPALHKAAITLGVEHRCVDTRIAASASRLLTAMAWRVRDHRPPRLARAEHCVRNACDEFNPTLLLTTGAAPLCEETLRWIGARGVIRANFSTDDPWSTVGGSRWQRRALREYDAVFTPRTANVDQLRGLGGPSVVYLPFGYDPDISFPEVLLPEEAASLRSGLLFVGGADDDRLAFIAPLVASGMDVALYGGYWDRYDAVRPAVRGIGTLETIRKATCAAAISLCLVRRSNRDDHVMRTFEMAAMGACMLVEDTPAHRSFFGPDGECVRYVGSAEHAIAAGRALLEQPDDRARMSTAVLQRVRAGAHTYADRLEQVIALCTDRPLRKSVLQNGRVEPTRAKPSAAGVDAYAADRVVDS